MAQNHILSKNQEILNKLNINRNNGIKSKLPDAINVVSDYANNQIIVNSNSILHPALAGNVKEIRNVPYKNAVETKFNKRQQQPTTVEGIFDLRNASCKNDFHQLNLIQDSARNKIVDKSMNYRFDGSEGFTGSMIDPPSSYTSFTSDSNNLGFKVGYNPFLPTHNTYQNPHIPC